MIETNVSQIPKNTLAAQGETYIQAATSDNTRAAYQSDIAHFQGWGGELPSSAEMVKQYLEAFAPSLNPRTLSRRLIALRQWHKTQNQIDPTNTPLVKKTLQGIRRIHGFPKQQAPAMTLSDLDRVVTVLNEQNTAFACRSQSMLLLGFFGAFRRSELVSLKWEQIQFERDGLIIQLPRSKTDQSGEGQTCVIPFGSEGRCPVQALIGWRQMCHQLDPNFHFKGPIFRRLYKSKKLLDEPITAHQWNKVIKQLAKNANLKQAEHFSAHSLRRGFATESARLGAPMVAIQRHGRWRSTQTVLEYIEAGRQFSDSAVNVLFDF